MTNTKLKFLTICLLWMFKVVSGQEIWRESFTVTGKGIMGDGSGNIISDMDGIDGWTIDYFNITLADEDDYAKTVSTSGGRFEVRDIDGEIVWRSEWINISDFDKFNIQLYAAETGSGTHVQTKYLKSFYRLDGGTEVPFHENNDLSGNWGSSVAACSGLSGNRLQIVCYLSCHYANDKVILDELAVSAVEKPSPPVQPGEVFLSEVLFNPYDGGKDYIEIYNRARRAISMRKLFLASRDKNLQLTQIVSLAGKITVIQPENYIAVTADTNGVYPFYQIRCTNCFQQVSQLPAYNNDHDYVVLLNENHEILDELYYNQKMHSEFLADVDGVALERVSFTQPTNEPGNWTSAAFHSGYGTPGYENSQTGDFAGAKPMVTFTPEAFSPNYDGYNDGFAVQYDNCKPNIIGNIKVFDSKGSLITHLVQNELMGTSGTVSWNGEDETGRRLPIGIYIVFVEFFNEEGEIWRYKKGVILTDLLN